MQPHPKPWWQSRTILGAAAVLLAQAANALGLDVDEGHITEALTALVSAAGALLAIVGRVRARQPIGGGR